MSKPTIPTADAAPYRLPLNHIEFRRALSAGLGRAWLHIAEHGPDGLQGEFLHTLLHTPVLDPQVEGYRLNWLIGLVKMAGLEEAVYPRFLERVHDTPLVDYDYYHISQRATILGYLAKKHMVGARDALYRLFIESRTTEPDTILGALDLIELYGEKGLLHVCSVLGNEAYEIDNDYVEDWFLHVFDEEHGEGSANKVLQAARYQDPGVDRFLAISKEMHESYDESVQSDAMTPDPDYSASPKGADEWPVERVIDWIKNAPVTEDKELGLNVDGYFWLSRWGRSASDSAIHEVLTALDASGSPVEQRRYLSIFVKRPMPRVSEHVVGLVASSHERVRSRACEALQSVADPRVREAALRSLTPQLMLSGSLKLFVSNYVAGDVRLIEDALFIPDDRYELDSLVSCIAELCERVKLPECISLMLFVYEYSPCAFCRGKVVQSMIELGLVPAWVTDECRFDGDQDIREKFGGLKFDH